MEIDITFDIYIVSNIKIQFCQKKKNVAKQAHPSISFLSIFFFYFLNPKNSRTVRLALLQLQCQDCNR